MKWRPAPGDRVRLTRKVATAFDRPRVPSAKRSWSERRGTVAWVSLYNHQVHVKWDDRRTVDHWPREALEKIGK
jgi:hypothetical protein